MGKSRDKYYIDTSFFLAVFDENDQHHKRALDFLDASEMMDAEFYIGWPTIWETTNALINR